MTHWLKREALWAALTISSHVVSRLGVLHLHITGAVIEMRKRDLQADLQPAPKPAKLIEPMRESGFDVDLGSHFNLATLPDDSEDPN